MCIRDRGHDDPTMIKALESYISSPAMDNEYNETDNRFDATKIPLDDPGVMELFHGTEVLGIRPEDIGGCPVGCLGIPEFGTDFVIQMVVDTKPQTLSDLIRISGLSHGTDVWLNNAQDVYKRQEPDGTASVTVSEAETGQVIQVPMKYTIDRDAKTVTIEKDLQAIREAVEESDGNLTQESMEAAAESLDDSFDDSVDQDTLTLSEREYGDQIILIKQ